MKAAALHSVIAGAIAAMAAAMPQVSTTNPQQRIERKEARRLTKLRRIHSVFWNSEIKGTYVSPEGAKRMRARRAAYLADSKK